MSQERVLREILVEIDRDPTVSQKKLSEYVGVSVGMVNWHIKRCVSKGLVKLQQAPVRRYLYYLTPEGFVEKSLLTAEYLRISFDIFRVGRQQYEALLNLCAANGWHNVVFLGNSELSELAALVCGRVEGVHPICILDFQSNETFHDGIQVLNTIKTLKEATKSSRVDAVIVTKFDARSSAECDPEMLREQFNLDQSRILFPAFLQ